MKVLFVSHRMNLSGAPQSLYSLVKRISQRDDLDIHVVGMKGGILVERFLELGVSVSCVGSAEDRGYLKSIYAFFKLALLVFKFSPDVIFINSAANLRALLVSKLFVGVKTVLYIHELDSMLSRNPFILYLRRKSILLADYILCVSNVNKQWAKEIGAKDERISVVPNAIDAEEVEEKLRSGTEKRYLVFIAGKKVVSIVGYMSHRKGVDYFIDIAVSFNSRRGDVVFVIIGDFETAEAKAAILARVDRCGLSHLILITGVVDNIYQYLKFSNVNCLVSREESLPRVVLESAYLGVPVVAFDVGGTKELLPTGYPYLIDCFNLSSAIAAIEEIILGVNIVELKLGLKSHARLFEIQETSQKIQDLLTTVNTVR